MKIEKSKKQLIFKINDNLQKFLKYFVGETMYKTPSKFQVVLKPKVVPLVNNIKSKK